MPRQNHDQLGRRAIHSGMFCPCSRPPSKVSGAPTNMQRLPAMPNAPPRPHGLTGPTRRSVTHLSPRVQDDWPLLIEMSICYPFCKGPKFLPAYIPRLQSTTRQTCPMNVKISLHTTEGGSLHAPSHPRAASIYSSKHVDAPGAHTALWADGHKGMCTRSDRLGDWEGTIKSEGWELRVGPMQ